MAVLESLRYQISDFIIFAIRYMTLQAGRWILLSLLILLPIFLLRKTLLRNSLFFKSALWFFLLLAPFSGKLKLFYEFRAGYQLFGWWADVCAVCLPVCVLYIAGAAAFAAYFISGRRKLARSLKHMEQRIILGRAVYLCNLPVSPFTAGVLKKKIVLPAKLVEQYKEEELETIISHEETHARLGHLLFFAVFNFLRVIIWPNPLLHISFRLFRQDMEDICDRTVMQNKQLEPSEYGLLLVKTARLLSGGQQVQSAAAFTGDGNYERLKQRIVKISGYRPFQRKHIAIGFVLCIMLTGGGIGLLHSVSYPRYTPVYKVSISDMDGKTLAWENEADIEEAVMYDANHLYLNNREFSQYLEKHQIDNTSVLIGINGYYKVPGWGSGMDFIAVDTAGLEGEATVLPYESYDMVGKVIQWMLKML